MMGGAGCVIKKCVSMERTKHDIALNYHGDDCMLFHLMLDINSNMSQI